MQISLLMVVGVFIFDKYYYKWKKKRVRRKYPNHEKFDDVNVDKMARGKNDDYESRNYSNIKISINLGHEVLKERDVLSMIATSVRDKYKAFVKSSKPHLVIKSTLILVISSVSLALTISVQMNFDVNSNIVINNVVKTNSADVNIDVRNSRGGYSESMPTEICCGNAAWARLEVLAQHLSRMSSNIMTGNIPFLEV